MTLIWYLVALLVLIRKKTDSTSLNVGTVLFTSSDAAKNCWTEYELSLLNARQIMQETLPEPNSVDFTKPKIVSVLLEYFKSCYETIGKNSCGGNGRIMYLAFSDSLGGYLRCCILPIIKRGYYAGQIEYSEAAKMFQLYEDVKKYLKTSGSGWSKQEGSYGVKFKVKPLGISNTRNELACSRLYLIEEKIANSGFPDGSCSRLHKSSNWDRRKKYQGNLRHFLRGNVEKDDFDKSSLVKSPDVDKIQLKGKSKQSVWMAHPTNLMEKKEENKSPLLQVKREKEKMMQNVKKKEGIIHAKKRKQNVKDTTRLKRGSDCDQQCVSHEKLIIPLPLLDDPEKPHSIAIPFKSRPLRNLRSRSSAYVLERYYVTVIRCMKSKCTNRKDLSSFNAQFYSWIASQVFPRLNDEDFYPAFGGILRIVETIKVTGYDNSGKKETNIKDTGYLYEKGIEFEQESEGMKMESEFQDEDEETGLKRYYLMGLTTISLIWLAALLYCCFLCVACRSKKEKGGDKCTCCPSPNLLSLQFIIRFFKKLKPCKCDAPRHRNGRNGSGGENGVDHRQDSSCQNAQDDDDNDEGKEAQIPEKARNTRQSTKSESLKNEKETENLDGRGDENVNVALTSVWPFKAETIKVEASGDAGKRVTTLWKKASSEMKKGSATGDDEEEEEEKRQEQKVFYVENTKNVFDYTRACPYSLINSTGNSGSTVQLQSGNETSLSKMDLFDHIIACHNTLTNTSADTYTQDSESESESERRASFSSSSPSSATTIEPKPK